jgi:hypothetical protein
MKPPDAIGYPLASGILGLSIWLTLVLPKFEILQVNLFGSTCRTLVAPTGTVTVWLLLLILTGIYFLALALFIFAPHALASLDPFLILPLRLEVLRFVVLRLVVFFL